MADDSHGGPLPLSDEEAEAARSRREALFAAVTDFDGALDGLSSGGGADGLRDALEALLDALRRHVTEAEDDDGLLVQTLELAPEFASRIEQLRREHEELVADAQAQLERAAAASQVGELLDDARGLSARIEQHRHRGTELLLDAYTLDISAGD